MRWIDANADQKLSFMILFLCKSLFKNSRLFSQLSLTVVFGKYPNYDPLTL